MPVPFTCPHCGVHTLVADEYIGQSGPCAGCGQTITVPPRPDTPGYVAPSGSGAQGWALIVVIGLGVLLLIGCFGAFSFLMVGSAPVAGPPPMATAPMPVYNCANNLQRIGMAMQQYVAIHGSYPPAYVADEDGKPLYSWRVLLLPYLGENNLYDQFDLSEPWNGPNNRRLLSQIPSVYRCPMAAGDPTTTNYMMVVGPGMLSDGASAAKPDEIKDGAQQTIAVIESNNHGIKWSEPRDLPAKDFDFTSSESLNAFRGFQSGKVNVLFVDGSVVAIADSTPGNEVGPLLTIAGGEPASGVPRYDPEH